MGISGTDINSRYLPYKAYFSGLNFRDPHKFPLILMPVFPPGNSQQAELAIPTVRLPTVMADAS